MRAENGAEPDSFLIKQVEKTILRHELLPDGAGVLVGLSGGPDSVALLIALDSLAPEHGWRVSAAHFNHGIRGSEADEDEAFCREFCQSLGVPFFSKKEDIPSFAKERGLSMETAGRLRRYEYLEEARSENGLEAIAVAHHMDDNAESVLMHLLRGSGLAGLTGIQPKRGRVIRPLLGVRRGDIESFLLDNDIPFRTDGTNLIAEGTRNRLRLTVMPYIEQHINPGLVPSLCSAAELMSRDEEYLSQIAEKALDEARLGEGYDRAALDALAEPIKARAIRIALARAGALVDIERVHIEAAEELLHGRTGASIDLPRARVFNSYERVIFTAPKAETEGFETELITEGVTETPFGCFKTETVQGTEGFFKSRDVGFLDLDLITLPLTVRTRRSGDRFFPVGAPGRRKLKDFFIDKKADRRLRDETPFVAKGDEALFIPGFGASELCRITNNTRHMLRIDYFKSNSKG